MKRTAIYVRVSTDEQSTDMQKEELLKLLSRRNVVPLVYEDSASGTSTKNRPQFHKLMSDIKDNKIDKVYVYKLDRFARSMCDFSNAIEILKSTNTEFISLKDNLDFSTPAGRLLVNMLGVFAQFEAEVIKQRCMDGIKSAKKRGVKFGKPKSDIPMDKIKQLRDRNFTFRAISERLNIPKSTLIDRVKNEKL